MAPAAAACPSLHELEGSCEYCGEPCDSTQDELNAINCTFEGCPSPEIYHQSCIEAYLKSIRLDKQRKTGFQCPRGCGKGSKWDKPCPGRVTKSHPIHARNDCSKKRRKAKMPEPTPPPVTSSTSKKQAVVVPKLKSLISEKEDSPEIEESKTTTTPAKAQVLNRASTLPPINRSSATSITGGECQGASAVGGMHNIKVGSPSGHNSIASYSEKFSDSGSADNSDSEGSVSSQLSSTPSRDFKEALAGPKLSVMLPVANAWTSGRPRNGDILSPVGKEQVPAVPLEIRPSPTHSATRPENCSASLQQPQLSQPSMQPLSADLASLEAEELELEERRKRAKTKNEKKHVQRAAARLREKRDALLAAGSTATKHAIEEIRTTTPSSESVGGKAVVTNRADVHGCVTVRPWSQSCLKAIMERKSTLVVHQLENLGFAPWQSILSVRVNGVDLHHCLEWLLRNGSKIQANMPCGPDQPMDIRNELKRLDELRKSKDFSQDQIESSVVSRAGDIDGAVAYLRSGGRAEVRAVLPHNRTTQAQTPILAARGGSTFGAATGSNASSWDGQQLLTSPSNSVTWPSHSKGLDFQNPNQFAGGECISDISRYNARVQSDNGYVSPKAVLSASTNGRQGFARETAKSSPVHVMNNDAIRPAGPYSHNLTHVESLPSTFSRQSSLKLESYGRSSNDVSVGRPFGAHVKEDLSLSRSMSGSGYFGSQSEHPPLENGCHGSSLFSEPTVSTVTSVTAAVLNDGRIDEQAIARLTESMDSSECSGLNTSHLHRIWGTQGLAVGSSSSSFYSSDVAPMLNSSSAALSQVFSAGISGRADCPSFGLSVRNSYPGGNWASNPISKSALTESIRSLGLSSAYGGAVSEVASANRLMSSGYSYGETGGWSESSATSEPHHKNGYFYSTAGLYEQTQMHFSDQQQQQPKRNMNGYSHTLADQNDYAIASAKTGYVGNGNAPSICLQQSPGARPPIDETGNDSLVSHLVEMLKV